MLFDDPEVQLLKALLSRLHARLAAARRDEAGYSTETVIVTALLAAAAIAAVTILAAKIIKTAKGVPTR